MVWPKVLLLFALLAGQTPQHPPPYPRPGTTQVFENDIIAVWDVAWLKQKYPLHTHRYDLIGVSYVEGDRIITQGDAPGRLTTTKAWVFQSNVAGNTHVEEGASDPPMRAILMEVKTAAPRADTAEPADGVDRFAAAPDALVRMDLHEQAAPDVAALEIGDAQRRRARRLLRVVDGLPECGQGPRGGGSRQTTGGQERTTTIARLHDDASSDSRVSTI